MNKKNRKLPGLFLTLVGIIGLLIGCEDTSGGGNEGASEGNEGASERQYAIKVPEDDPGGTIEITSREPAETGEWVTLTITPKEGYTLIKPLTIKSIISPTKPIPFTPEDIYIDNSDPRTILFLMPRGDVEINATFRESNPGIPVNLPSPSIPLPGTDLTPLPTVLLKLTNRNAVNQPVNPEEVIKYTSAEVANLRWALEVAITCDSVKWYRNEQEKTNQSGSLGNLPLSNLEQGTQIVTAIVKIGNTYLSERITVIIE